MRNLLLYMIMFCLTFAVSAQEEDTNTIAIPSEAEQNEQHAMNADLTTNQQQSVSLGSFHIHFISLPNEVQINSNTQDPINIVALSEAQEMRRQAHIQQQFPMRQLKGIQEHAQVLDYSPKGWGRTSNSFGFYDNDSPRGGIKNEALEDIRQPFINPYYSPYYHHNYYNRPTGGFYFYRR